ncbi:thiosulfate:glutathione sulfurtransferase-like [Leucoraja erinacea]|uniref:thiosulfate:glutathione sulfurtransferase-like n=1 Tax=Leucoraja erinaceus TaxID=7782 RepID=UPI00245793D3|nr:thiosulfate:glutathione sulfurtransferase-like [Leucoraja erinacea]
MGSTASEITCEQLERMMVDGRVTIFDVRNPDELENGRIVGSVNIPVDKVKDAFSLDAENFQDQFGAEKPKLESMVVFYCKAGRRGNTAVTIARDLGYTRAVNVIGGFQKWTGED